MKVHITLVGGQPAPVYHGIVATNPDKVVYIYSKNTEHVFKKLKSLVSIPVDEIPALDTTDPIKISECAQMLADRYSEDDITLNISSGLKTWSHLFGIVFDKLPNAAVVYMDQNNRLWNYKTMQCTDDFVFDMDMLFILYGNELKHYRKFSEYTDEDFNVTNQLEEARRYNHNKFVKLTTVLSKDWAGQLNNQKQGCFEVDYNNFVEWCKPNYVHLTLWNNRKFANEWELKSPHAADLAFNSGWFEYKIARMLSHWQYTREIRMNCIFPPIEAKDKSKAVKFPKNEIDIIVDAGTKILFVECKTQINNSTDIDKFNTAVKNYGGIGSKALFITDTCMNEIQKEKCRESRIIPFSLQDHAPNIVEQMLFKYLNETLFDINI